MRPWPLAGLYLLNHVVALFNGHAITGALSKTLPALAKFELVAPPRKGG